MTPQGQFTVVAPIAAGRETQLHFARFVILNDPTVGDIEVYGVPRPELPVYLAFMGDCDGPAGEVVWFFLSLVIALVASPFLLVLAPLLIFQLRRLRSPGV